MIVIFVGVDHLPDQEEGGEEEKCVGGGGGEPANSVNRAPSPGGAGDEGEEQ